MRRLSIGWFWLVVALALQGAATIGFGRFDESPAIGRDEVYCEAGGGSSADRRTPAGHGRHAADCISCQTCLGGSSPLLTHTLADPFAGPRYSSSGVWPVRQNSEPRPQHAQSHRARAPPSRA
ncbi:MAG: hypothetical protein C3F11_01320 [Methylocystaceae bacterium]|nr:MAG: hypothetical protein C3F11_01320 [Methylocystaceae bacterium]